MATWDPLKLVVLGRKYSYYPRPSELDSTLNGFIGYGFVTALAFTFGVAVLASYLGAELTENIVGQAIAVVVVWSVYLLIWIFYISSVPSAARALILVPALIIVASLTALALLGRLGHWYLYVPLFVFCAGLSWVCAAQLAYMQGKRNVESSDEESAA